MSQPTAPRHRAGRRARPARFARPARRARPARPARAKIGRLPVLLGLALVLCLAATGTAALALTGFGAGPAPRTGAAGAGHGSTGPATSIYGVADPAEGIDASADSGSATTPPAAGPGLLTAAGSTARTTGAAAPAALPPPLIAAPGSSAGPSAAVTSGRAPAVPAPTVNPHPSSVNISANIAAVPSTDATCRTAPTGAACTNAALAALDHARAALGLPAYGSPANFASMTPAQQLLTLSNLDRVLYGLPPITGLNATINSAAQLGVTNGGDPVGVTVNNVQWTSWASNWASGYPNAAFTYYAWMYDDGPGSPNGDCTASNTSGCWGHRLNTLHSFGANVQIAMGVGSAGTTFTELYEGFPSSAAIAYL